MPARRIAFCHEPRIAAHDPSEVLGAVKDQKAQLTNIQTTLDGIAAEIGVRDHSALLAAVIDLKNSVANTQRSLDMTNHRVGDLATHMAPRTFDENAQLAALAASPQKGEVDIVCSMGDSDGCALADRIDAILKKARGWGSHGVSTSVFDHVPVGIFVRVHSAASAPKFAGQLQKALAAAGIEAPGAEHVQIPEGSLQLLVGTKPASMSR